MEQVQIAPFETHFQNYKLTCPVLEGHKMLQVRTVCSIIDVDFQTQDSWIKQHPFFAQLYRISYMVAADGKQREMNCMSFFDTYAWVASISPRNREEESIEKQTMFLVWLREHMMGFYKSVDVFIQENKYEAQMEDLKLSLEIELNKIQEQSKALKQKIKEIDTSILDIRHNRFSGQTALPFAEN